MKVAQVISRNNDINGNPFRLIIVSEDGLTVQVLEARQSRPNWLYNNEMLTLDTIHVQPAEYNRLKRKYKNILEHTD